MAADEPFKRYEQAGAAFVDAAVNRLNGLFRGASGPGHDATDREDDGTDRGDDGTDRAERWRRAPRERTEHLIEVIRSEIRSQLHQLGLATQEDTADVRSRLEALESRLRVLESRVAFLSPPALPDAPAGAAEERGATQEDPDPGGADSGGTTS
jgi:hypothetical protein